MVYELYDFYPLEIQQTDIFECDIIALYVTFTLSFHDCSPVPQPNVSYPPHSSVFRNTLYTGTSETFPGTFP